MSEQEPRGADTGEESATQAQTPDWSEADQAAADAPEAPSGEALIVNVDGFEGPLDLLLVLARAQKVDLRKISILALVEQYLAFIAEARRSRLELAADYLVMAAWLTYLKSRLLLPPEPGEEDDEPTGEELAARLQFQLRRLEAMRSAAARLMARDRLGQDMFARGSPETIRLIRKSEYNDTLYDLLTAYARQRTRAPDTAYEVRRPAIYRIEDARHRLERMLGEIKDWNPFDVLMPPAEQQDEAARVEQRTALASMLTAGLEMVRDGVLELRQLRHFGPIYVRRRAGKAAAAPEAGAEIIPMERS
ncbi:MAG: segregation and condensation protein A [Alphaproteobacteria bacterium]